MNLTRLWSMTLSVVCVGALGCGKSESPAPTPVPADRFGLTY